MKTSQKLVALPAIGLALAGLLTGCASNSATHTADEATQAATTAVATSSATPSAASSATPTATATTPAAAPTAGATVPAAQVAAVRAAGAHVYVSPNGSGDGLVVDPSAALPAVVVADTHSALRNVNWTDGTKTAADFSATQKAYAAAGKAMQAAGIKAFVLETWPQNISGNKVWGKTSVTIGAIDPDAIAWLNARGGAPSGATAQEALASPAAKALFAAFPGVPVITFDSVVTQP